MVIKREAFERTRLDEERADDKSKVITVRLNLDELAALEADGKLLRQEKISTTLKQVWEIGHIVLHGSQTQAILDVAFNNERRNKRIGIDQAEPKFQQM